MDAAYACIALIASAPRLIVCDDQAACNVHEVTPEASSRLLKVLHKVLITLHAEPGDMQPVTHAHTPAHESWKTAGWVAPNQEAAGKQPQPGSGLRGWAARGVCLPV